LRQHQNAASARRPTAAGADIPPDAGHRDHIDLGVSLRFIPDALARQGLRRIRLAFPEDRTAIDGMIEQIR
jgi:hypothetical protein